MNSQIESLIGRLSYDQLERHKLLGFACSRGIGEPSLLAQRRLLANIRREASIRTLLDEVSVSAAGLPIALLKGTALWEDVYRPGEREVSDIDFFVPQGHEPAFKSVLEKMAFRSVPMRKEKASEFKTLFRNEVYGDLSLEVHTQLWWREPRGFAWRWRPSSRQGFLRLSTEDQLIHLCGHWISQHTMISLHWLVDIMLYIDKHTIDWQTVDERAKILRLSRAVGLAREFSAGLKARAGASSMDVDFLVDPQKNKLRYFWIKHSVQESWRDALLYDYHWLRSRLRLDL